MLDDNLQKPPFSAEEVRVLGCLMEKHLTTPNNYPLTFNSLMLACNQKSSREPVMNMKEGQVGHIAKDLAEQGWAIIQNTERAQRVEHKIHRRLKLTQKQQAILTVLLLRRPQTLNEIKTRTERMAEFESVDEIREILEDWMTSESPLAMRLPASSGRREDRYYHTLGGETLADLQAEKPDSSSSASSNNDENYDALLTQIADLESRLAALEAKIAQ